MWSTSMRHKRPTSPMAAWWESGTVSWGWDLRLLGFSTKSSGTLDGVDKRVHLWYRCMGYTKRYVLNDMIAPWYFSHERVLETAHALWIVDRGCCLHWGMWKVFGGLTMAFGSGVVPAVTMNIRLSEQGVGSKAPQVLWPLTFAISRGAELVTMVSTLCVHIIASSCGILWSWHYEFPIHWRVRWPELESSICLHACRRFSCNVLGLYSPASPLSSAFPRNKMHPTNTIFENQIAKKAPLKRDLPGAYRDSKAFNNLHLK